MQDINDGLKIDINLFNKLNIRVRDIAWQVIKEGKAVPDNLSVNTRFSDRTAELIKSPETIVVEGIDDLYEKNLPVGITLSTLKTISNYNQDFEAGILLGVNCLALDNILDNPDVTTATCSVPMGAKNTLNTFTSIDTDESQLLELRFMNNVRTNIDDFRATGKESQSDIAKMLLRDLFIKALCE